MSVNTGDITLEYDYNDNGDLIFASDLMGSKMNISYNENNWISRIKRFDSNSELVSCTDYTISWSGRMDISITPMNNTLTLIHDRSGNVVSSASNNGLPLVAVELPFLRQRLIGDEVSNACIIM